MPLCFQPRPASSFDPNTGVSIPRPRILPTTLPDGQPGTEYQYAFIRDEKVIDGLGFSGPDAVVETAGHRERVFTLDLGHAWVITSMLDFKQTLGLLADDYDFLHALAQGLVLAYAGRTDNRTDVRYVAVTTPEALLAAGISNFADEALKLDGTITLAEVAIPASLR